jgi:hypothetical protein
MATLIAPRPAVKATRPAAPEVDGFPWEFGPDADDDQWHATPLTVSLEHS